MQAVFIGWFVTYTQYIVDKEEISDNVKKDDKVMNEIKLVGLMRRIQMKNLMEK